MKHFYTPRLASLGLLAVTLVAGAPVAPAQEQDAIIEIVSVFPNVAFEFPVGFRHAGDGSDRVYVVEHGGRVKVLKNSPGTQEAAVFLDISERLATDPAGEFFTIEFHPDYAENGHVFVRYKLRGPHRTVLSRFTRSADDHLAADPASEVVLLEIPTPENEYNHHGGDLTFGPDGYLYVALGDGGTPLDEAGNAQDPGTLLGSVLRIDVDNPTDERPYGIPPDNPFVGNSQGWREEVFAYGFRNPWRMTIDRETGEVWVGDVGEAAWEEVNRVEAGRNYGWPTMEGPECVFWEGCDQSDLTLPVWAYGRNDGSSITGGYIYRGNAIPVLRGKYLFSDFAVGKLWALDVTDSEERAVTHLFDAWTNVTSFGEDAEGELYFTGYFDGAVYKILPGPGASSGEVGPPTSTVRLETPYPNPATGLTRFGFSVADSTRARLVLYDLLGREVATLFEGDVPAGAYHEVPFDTRGLAAGVYLSRLETGGAVVVKRVVVAG